MTPQVMRVLKKLYRYDNRSYNAQNEPCYSEAALSEKEQALLSDYGWKPNDIHCFSGHQDIISYLHTLKDHPALTKERCLDAFVAGIGGSYLRGLSVLPAWYHLVCCPGHIYEEKPPYACCWVCGQEDDPVCINNSYFQYCLYLGNAYSSTPLYAYLNLRHLTEVAAVQPVGNDILALSALLALLRDAPDDETPGKFEKRLSEARIIKGDKYVKRGILNSLVIVGVIPNQFVGLSDKSWANFGDVTILERQLPNTRGRSDMEMPWAGWLGSLGLNETRVEELFGRYLTTVS